ncbi:hypothetical protein C8A01DRAFT_12432 [Parachaetomium inaequale]|uniref:Uncharacterized protein n=1 Tax=Parachaetomium inaequale TaxID=2588326 RepID=A0AAN6SVS0_9PEZI|nr:hypothetical protein C8A01DRAFT_12432 [Parachaetomium inaequale]
MRSDLFDCLPRPAALVVLSTILQLTDAHAVQKLARQTPQPTITIPYHALNVVSWPLRPTPPPGAPVDLFARRRRQADDTFNTVCGYINGDLDVPATCGSGSHCVVDTEHNVVGCCPNGAPSCTAGVFTGCVDANSGPQTELNPYVFSCSGANVCYSNVYDGGFSQYGCGTASDLAATVQNSAAGLTAALTRPTVSISYTQGVSTLTEPTTLGTASSRSSTSTRTSASSSATSASSTTESTAAANPAATTDPAAPPATDTAYRTGAIVGGTIGGLAVAIALVALVMFFLRRRNANVRRGPGPGGVRGKFISPPQPGGGSGFAALAHDDHDAFETGPAGSVLNQPPLQQQQSQQQMSMSSTAPNTTTAAAAAAAAATAAAAAAAGAAASAPPLASRSMLPPIATGPPMPFQNSDVSPVDHHDLDTPFAYSNSAVSGAAGLSSAGAASVSSYPPSSSGGVSGTGVGAGVGDAAAGGYQYGVVGPAAYAGGSGLMMGMNPLLLNRGAERQLDSDQVPLTSAGGREIDDFSQGFHAALGRIGEEDEEEEEEGGRQQQQGYQGGYQDHVGRGDGNAGHEGGTLGSEGSGQGRPLWQQNRRQSRNLMWM